jgi:nucleoside-diphosphate-sugar epimerase
VPRNAFVLGGTGDVGRAIARSLLDDGWSVMLASKGSPAPPGLEDVPVVHLDRNEEGALAPANGFDLLVDVVPFEVEHADQLLELDVGHIVAISSASVYADDDGRTLDEAETPEQFPEFDGPIPETQRLVEPGDKTYSTKKVALELRLLENDRIPATTVRPCAIYGPGDRMAREWFFVKRALDGRPYILLTLRGANHFHTTASANIGELVRLIADRKATGSFNSGDPDPPTVLELARRIASTVGHDWTEVLLPNPEGRGMVGNTPWSAAKPFIVDMAAAERELGYSPATTWNDAIDAQIRWLIEATRERDWQEVLPRGAQYLQFDYDGEDALVAELAGGKA